MPKMIEITAAEYERLQDCIREDGMRIAALIEENKALHQDAKRLTAAGAVPVLHGRWLQVDEDAWTCTACGNIVLFLDGGPNENNAKYCPVCGAKMNGDGKTNETVQGV